MAAQYDQILASTVKSEVFDQTWHELSLSAHILKHLFHRNAKFINWNISDIILQVLMNHLSIILCIQEILYLKSCQMIYQYLLRVLK